MDGFSCTTDPVEVETGGGDAAFRVTCEPPFLLAAFHEDQTMLSWSLTRPGFRVARRVAWLEVRNDDLPESVDPAVFLETRMRASGLDDAVTLMTSREVRCHHLTEAWAGGVRASCLATVGLTNAVRVGTLRQPFRGAGTVNMLVHVSCPLSQAALIETISVVTQARTAAILDLDLFRDGVRVSGTGTDCIVAAAPASGAPRNYAGLHTQVGEAVGRAVCSAIAEGGALWLAQCSPPAEGRPAD